MSEYIHMPNNKQQEKEFVASNNATMNINVQMEIAYQLKRIADELVKLNKQRL